MSAADELQQDMADWTQLEPDETGKNSDGTIWITGGNIDRLKKHQFVNHLQECFLIVL